MEQKELNPVKNIIHHNQNSGLNTVKNLDRGIERIKNGQKRDPQSKKSFDVGTGNIEIKYFDYDTGASVKINTCNADGSSDIIIEQRNKDNICVWVENHSFDRKMFKYYVNQLLTQNELDEQKAFEQQVKERKDALKKAHDSSPRTCAGYHRCEHCINEQRELEISTPLPLGQYT